MFPPKADIKLLSVKFLKIRFCKEKIIYKNVKTAVGKT